MEVMTIPWEAMMSVQQIKGFGVTQVSFQPLLENSLVISAEILPFPIRMEIMVTLSQVVVKIELVTVS